MAGDLISILESRMKEFSKNQKLIAKYVMENYDKAAYMTASKLGELVGVSESTVVRFAAELGYDGYKGLQRSLQTVIRTKLTANQRVAVTNKRIGDNEIPDRVLTADMEQIRNTLDTLDKDAFYRAVDRIIAARTIYIMGVRTSASLADFLSSCLNIVFDNIKLVRTTSGSEVFESLFPMRKEDVLIAISFPRYSSRIINAVEYANAVGAGVIAITDNGGSPLASRASEALLTQSDMMSYTNSLVAAMSVINAIVVAIGKKRQTEITDRFDKLEKIWDEYDVYAKDK